MPLSGQTAPREQLARSQSIPPRRRRYLPPPIVALAHDPALLFQRPTTPGTSLDHLKSRHLRHSRMISHTPMSSPPHPSHKAVLSAGIQIVIESWRRHYNTIRPHASLGYKPPAPEVFVPAFAAWPAALRRPASPATLAQPPTLN